MSISLIFAPSNASKVPESAKNAPEENANAAFANVLNGQMSNELPPNLAKKTPIKETANEISTQAKSEKSEKNEKNEKNEESVDPLAVIEAILSPFSIPFFSEIEKNASVDTQKLSPFSTETGGVDLEGFAVTDNVNILKADEIALKTPLIAAHESAEEFVQTENPALFDAALEAQKKPTDLALEHPAKTNVKASAMEAEKTVQSANTESVGEIDVTKNNFANALNKAPAEDLASTEEVLGTQKGVNAAAAIATNKSLEKITDVKPTAKIAVDTVSSEITTVKVETSAPVNALANGTAPAAKIETTTIVMNTPMRETTTWTNDLGQKIIWLANGEKQSAQIILNPRAMGPIEVSLQVEKGVTTAHFVASNAETRESLENALPRLREMFANAGISLGDANVSAESSNKEAQNNQQARHFFSKENLVEGEELLGDNPLALSANGTPSLVNVFV